jgi:hypothetical protein
MLVGWKVWLDLKHSLEAIKLIKRLMILKLKLNKTKIIFNQAQLMKKLICVIQQLLLQEKFPHQKHLQLQKILKKVKNKNKLKKT